MISCATSSNNRLLLGLLVLRPPISSLLQSATTFITKCDKCYYKVRKVSKSATILSLSAIGITKWDDYYKGRQNKAVALCNKLGMDGRRTGKPKDKYHHRHCNNNNNNDNDDDDDDDDDYYYYYYFEEYVDEKVEEWVAQVTSLAEFATTQPQSSYAAFVFGLRHRWTYFLRTLPDIAPFLEPLERAIADLLVPAITEHVTTQEERDLLELPVRLGGLGVGEGGTLIKLSFDNYAL